VQDPERLLNRGTRFERALLRGGVAERPNARLARRMALGAGVGGALSYTASAKALVQTWWGKTVAVTLVGGGVAVGVAGAMSGGADSDTLDPAPQAVVPAAARKAEPRPPRPPAPEAQSESQARPGTLSDGTSPAAPATPNPRPRSHKPASSLAEEVKALDRVRASLTRGDRATALRELDRYDQQHPAGTLRREAQVLRTRATEQP
jgi:hypothetical protein